MKVVDAEAGTMGNTWEWFGSTSAEDDWCISHVILPRDSSRS